MKNRELWQKLNFFISGPIIGYVMLFVVLSSAFMALDQNISLYFKADLKTEPSQQNTKTPFQSKKTSQYSHAEIEPEITTEPRPMFFAVGHGDFELVYSQYNFKELPGYSELIFQPPEQTYKI